MCWINLKQLIVCSVQELQKEIRKTQKIELAQGVTDYRLDLEDR